MPIDNELSHTSDSAPARARAAALAPDMGSRSTFPHRERRSAILRTLLGLTQITLATVSLQLLLQRGIDRWSLGALIATGACTTASIHLFGKRSRIVRGEVTRATLEEDEKPRDLTAAQTREIPGTGAADPVHARGRTPPVS